MAADHVQIQLQATPDLKMGCLKMFSMAPVAAGAAGAHPIHLNAAVLDQAARCAGAALAARFAAVPLFCTAAHATAYCRNTKVLLLTFAAFDSHPDA